MADFDPTPGVAHALGLPAAGVAAVIALLAEGATVPFIARYRKERTGGLDEVQIRDVRDAHRRAVELHERRQTVLATIEAQGQLTPALRARLLAADTLAALEDLYLPYRPRRRTRATVARERGLEPLARRILAQPRDGRPAAEAARFVGGEVPDADAALAGARDIVAEIMSEDADIRAKARDATRRRGVLVARPVKGATEQRTRFEQYYDFSEAVARIAPHRVHALLRGEAEGVLKVKLDAPEDAILAGAGRALGHDARSPFAPELAAAVADGYKRLLAPSLEKAIRADLKAVADAEAANVFARNVHALLLAPPLGERRVVALDPGLRTGCKCVAVDETGRLLAHGVIFPGQGAARDAQARADLAALLRRHRPFALAVGNGTGGREAADFCRKVLRDEGLRDIAVVEVSESGASVYSASDLARAEFPDLDLTVRGAISIARRLQDPLAELVKIEPKSIGVGQYQHDVPPALLDQKLDEVVESAVNAVGVRVPTASAPLLARVAGIGPKLAERIVAWRDTHGAPKTRRELLKVPGFGPRTFEQAAGFLRVDGPDPLDASAVHPERYGLVARMAKDLGVPVARLIGDEALIGRIELARYVDAEVGLPTLRDIVAELKKPGRDPRAAFEPPRFRDDVHSVDDLETGMILDGVVSNVTHFGAFVDLGVHQDGLIHISKLSDRFVRDPHEVVKVGDPIRVVVLDVDRARKRISLSARDVGDA
ncbi:MAG: RNA-binding transcriptional accessory protein [Myxococcales bacterium]|nr:RNA-binding transcriptional accessory protein [Myxococcales bacterium]